MAVKWHTEWPHWVLLVLLVSVIARVGPADVPIHWGLNGEANQSANKWVAVALAFLVYGLLLLLPRLDPGRANYAQFGGAYNAIRLALLAVIVVLVGSSALGLRAAGLVHVVIGGLFFTIGSVLGKVRPNWFVGIRTPWTLTSKRAWTRTHRLGGWLFMAWGVAELVAGLVLPAAQITLVAGIGIAAILLVYSYLVWRSDPDKLPAVGTRPAE